MLKNLNWTKELGKTAFFPYNKETYCLLKYSEQSSIQSHIIIDFDRDKKIDEIPGVTIIREEKELEKISDQIDSIVFLDTPDDFKSKQEFAGQWKMLFDFVVKQRKKCLFNNLHISRDFYKVLEKEKIPFGTPFLNASALSYYSRYYQAYTTRKGLKSRVIGFFGTTGNQLKNCCMLDFYRFLQKRSIKANIISKNGTGFLYGFSHLVSAGYSPTKYQNMMKSFIMEENENNNSLILLSGQGAFSKDIHSLSILSSINVDYPVLVVNVFDEIKTIDTMISRLKLFNKKGTPPTALYISSRYKTDEGIVEVDTKALEEKIKVLEKEFTGLTVTAGPWIEKMFPAPKKETKKIS